MRRIGLVLILLFVLIFSGFATTLLASSPKASNSDYAPQEILVKFKPGTPSSVVAAVHRQNKGLVREEIPQISVQVVKFHEGDVPGKINAYSRNPNVEYAEPNYIAYAFGVPNDTDFYKEWGMDNSGQVYKYDENANPISGTTDADIDAPEAWGITTGDAGIKIAILDTGIDQEHPDLSSKIIINGNFNFTNSPTVDDLYGHGTHVAGTAAAITGNEIGVAGVGYNSSLMNVKVLNDSGSGAYSWVAQGIIRAADKEAKVINMSLGGNSPSKTLESAVNYAWGKGVVLVAAAGNSNNPSPTYPAKYDNVIAVAATNSNDQKASFSSYGDWVDVAAPGVDIYSTFPNHSYSIGKSLNYDYGSGTSMATPHVAGLAALVWATGYGTNQQTVRNRIETKADPISGTGTYWTWGRVNACNAVGGNCSRAPTPTSWPTPTVTPTPTSVPEGTPTPTPTATPIPSGTMHVLAISMWYETKGPNYFVYTKVTVVNENNNSVPEAVVDLVTTLPDISTVLSSAISNGSGEAILKLKSQQTGTYSSKITNVTKDGWVYDPIASITSSKVTIP